MGDEAIALVTHGLGKRYRIGQEPVRAPTFLGRVAQTALSPFSWLASQLRAPTEAEILWAMRDVSFEVKHGEVVGIIGKNGAGKSTLLKVLSRITEPTAGSAQIRGRVASLLEVGTGMHPELTGRENIYMNGTILGMRKREIDVRYSDIVEFSGIQRFVDTPVKRYSSGMRVRLGFSIAAHLEPDVLIVDEVLAVGDVEFQNKCMGRMRTVAGAGRTVLLVSHNMGAILSLCERAILMEDGRIVADGPAADVVQRYLAIGADVQRQPLDQRVDREGDGKVQIIDCCISATPGGIRSNEVLLGEEFIITLTVDARERVVPYIALSVLDELGKKVAYIPSRQNAFCPELAVGRHTIEIAVGPLPIVHGRFSMVGALVDSTTLDIHDRIENIAHFSVVPTDVYDYGQPITSFHGLVHLPNRWKYTGVSDFAPTGQPAP